MVGVLVFLVLLLVAVQVLFNLYATSAVTAATYDGARIAAGAASSASVDPRGDAEAHVRSVLGRYASADRLSLRWGDSADTVVLTVRAQNPSFLPRALRGPLGIDVIERTARVRVERVVAP
jgi:hypothetical protein